MKQMKVSHTQQIVERDKTIATLKEENESQRNGLTATPYFVGFVRLSLPIASKMKNELDISNFFNEIFNPQKEVKLDYQKNLNRSCLFAINVNHI